MATMTPVKSSNVASVGYDESGLRVQFKDGASYLYKGVPAETYANLMSADSIGKFLASEIRGKFPGRKLDAEPNPG